MRVSQDASIVTTADHRAGKIEAEFYDKVSRGIFGVMNDLSHTDTDKKDILKK